MYVQAIQGMEAVMFARFPKSVATTNYPNVMRLKNIFSRVMRSLFLKGVGYGESPGIDINAID